MKFWFLENFIYYSVLLPNDFEIGPDPAAALNGNLSLKENTNASFPKILRMSSMISLESQGSRSQRISNPKKNKNSNSTNALRKKVKKEESMDSLANKKLELKIEELSDIEPSTSRILGAFQSEQIQPVSSSLNLQHDFEADEDYEVKFSEQDNSLFASGEFSPLNCDNESQLSFEPSKSLFSVKLEESAHPSENFEDAGFQSSYEFRQVMQDLTPIMEEEEQQMMVDDPSLEMPLRSSTSNRNAKSSTHSSKAKGRSNSENSTMRQEQQENEEPHKVEQIQEEVDEKNVFHNEKESIFKIFSEQAEELDYEIDTQNSSDVKESEMVNRFKFLAKVNQINFGIQF